MGMKMEMAEREDKLLTDMLGIIRFTEGVSAKLHRVPDEAKIYQVVKDEFAKSGRYLASILLLADDGASLRLVETSMPPSKLEVLEKASGLRAKEYLIKLSKSSIFRQVVREGKTVQANVSDMIREFLPRPLAYLISKTMGYDKQSSILAPLHKHGKVIGVLVMSCTDLCEYFTHSVENLALHISTALELAHEHAQRNRALQALKRYQDHLGELVEERTAELKTVNEKLLEDITKRKRAEEALQAEKNKLQSLVDTMGDGFNIRDTDYNLTYQNEPERRIWGDHRGEKCYRVFEGRDEVCEGCPVEQAFKDGKSHTAERRTVTPSEEVVFWENTANPIRDAEGRIVACLEVTRNITERKRAEEALADEATRRRILVDQSLDGIVVLDEDAKVYEANQRFAEMLGYSPEEVRELHTWDWDKQFPPEQLLEMGRKVDEKGLHIETQHHRKDGSVIDVDISVNGAMCGGQKLIFCVCREITERKRAEEALRESREKFQKMFESVTDAISVVDLNGVIIETNQRAVEMHGFTSKDEIVGRNALELVAPCDRERILANMRKAVKEGTIRGVEYTLPRADGTEFPGELSTNVLRDASGKVVAHITIARDITERKQAEEALNRQRAYFQQLFANSPDAIALLDTADRFINVNKGFEALFGYGAEEIKGRFINDTIVPEDRIEEASVLSQARFSNKVVRKETVRRRKDGSLVDVSLLGYSIRFDSKIIGTYVIYTDITERKRAEEALRESESKFKNLFEYAKDAVLLADAETGILVDVNPAACRMLGLPKEKVVGMHQSELHPPETVDYYKRLFRNHAEKGEAVTEDLIVQRADGSLVPVNISASGFELGGRRIMQGVFRDVTESKQAEEALQAEKNKLQSLIDAMEDQLTIRDKDYNLIYQSERVRKIWGDHVGEKCYRVFEGRDEVCEGCPVEQAFKDGKSHIAERRTVTPSGEVVFWENTANPIRDAEGRIVASLEIGRNITERKKRGQLQRDENYVLTLLGQGAELNELLGSILRLGEYHDPCIKGSVMLFDSSKEQLFLASAPSFPDNYKELFKEGIPIGPKAGSCGTAAYHKERVIVPDIAKSPLFKPFEEVVRRATKNGLLSCWSQPIISSNGELLGTIANYGNKVGGPSAENLRVLEWSARIAAIAIERKQAEEALVESQKFSSSLLESSPNPITVVNLDTSTRYVNPAFEKLTGFTLAEVVGRKAPYPWWVEGERERMLAAFKNVIEHGGSRTGSEHNLQNKNGEHFWVALNSAPVMQDGKPVYLIISWLDITERKRSEEKEKQLRQELYLAQRLASVGELAAGVAHEINNPLTGVLGFSQRLMRKSTDEEVSRDLEIIHSEARRAADVVQNLLTFARRRQPKKEYANINDILQRTLELRAYALQTSNIEVTTAFVPSLPEVMVDFPQMQEVFLNIILNAEQAMSEARGRGTLIIKTRRIKDYVRISFADDGPGISPENLDKIFDPFFTTREQKGGTGLGLSACHGVVTEHGGRIYVRSKPGKGATFIVELLLSPLDTTVKRRV